MSSPRSGDVIAEAINYSDATAHVGFVTYPKDVSATVKLAAGDKKKQKIDHLQQSVSAASKKVIENDWGFRAKQTIGARRYGTP